MSGTIYLQTTFQRFFIILKKRGINHIIVFCTNYLFSYFIEKKLLFFKRSYFFFNGDRYSYFYHRYNLTWLNERCVEIPIFSKLLSDNIQKSDKILEVGNVLSNYFTVHHDIIDKYDTHDFVNKIDIIEFSPRNKYDLIFCISTLEHIGWDEEPKQPEKILIVLSKLQSLLSKHGIIYLSIPIGENIILDEYLRTGRIQFDQQYNFLRISKRNWIETSWDKIKDAKSNTPFRFANAMVLGILKK